MKGFLFFVVALFLSVTTAGCLTQGGDSIDQDEGVQLCLGGEFVPVDACAAPICAARRELASLQQQKQLSQAPVACSKGTAPEDCGHGSQKGQADQSDTKVTNDAIAEAQQRVAALDDSYLQCCSDEGGDTGYGISEAPDLVKITVSGNGKDPINYIKPEPKKLVVVLSILGCEHSQVRMKIDDVPLNISGVSVVIEQIQAGGNFVAMTGASDMGSMTVSFTAHVAVGVGDLGLADDRVAFLLTTDTKGGKRFQLDENGTASGTLALLGSVKGEPGGAFEHYELDLYIKLEIEGMEDPFL